MGIVVLSLGLMGCDGGAPFEDEPDTETVLTSEDLTITVPPGAFPGGVELEVERPTSLPLPDTTPLTYFEPIAEPFTLAPTDGSSAPGQPLRVELRISDAIDVAEETLMFVVRADDDDEIRVLPAGRGPDGGTITTPLAHTGTSWPVRLDAEALSRDTQEMLGDLTEPEDCNNDAQVGFLRYFVQQTSHVWVCLGDDDGELAITIGQVSPMPYAIDSAGVVDPGVVSTRSPLRITTGIGEPFSLEFRPEPSILLLRLLEVTLDVMGLHEEHVDALEELDCFDGIVDPDADWNRDAAVNMVRGFYECAATIPEPSPVHQLILSELADGPERLVTTLEAVVDHHLGTGGFTVAVEADPVRLDFPGVEVDSVQFDHPTWGPVTLVSSFVETNADFQTGEPHVTLFRSTGERVWKMEDIEYEMYEVHFADPPIDATGQVFLQWYGGRYDYVAPVAPVPEGMEADSSRWIYTGSAKDLDGDGVYEIVKEYTDCEPTCAGGSGVREELWWDGQWYTPR